MAKKANLTVGKFSTGQDFGFETSTAQGVVILNAIQDVEGLNWDAVQRSTASQFKPEDNAVARQKNTPTQALRIFIGVQGATEHCDQTVQLVLRENNRRSAQGMNLLIQQR